MRPRISARALSGRMPQFSQTACSKNMFPSSNKKSEDVLQYARWNTRLSMASAVTLNHKRYMPERSGSGSTSTCLCMAARRRGGPVPPSGPALSVADGGAGPAGVNVR